MGVICPARAMMSGNLSEWEGGQTHLPERINHELRRAGSQATDLHHLDKSEEEVEEVVLVSLVCRNGLNT